MTKRKKSADYRKEYDDVIRKKTYTENKIKERLFELCDKYPDILVDRQVIDIRKPHVLEPMEFSATTLQFKEKVQGGMPVDIDRLLQVMVWIEEHIASLHPHQQTKMFESTASPSNPDAVL